MEVSNRLPVLPISLYCSHYEASSRTQQFEHYLYTALISAWCILNLYQDLWALNWNILIIIHICHTHHNLGAYDFM